MTPQVHSADDIAVAEAELTRQEAALVAEVNRLKGLRRDTAAHLAHLKQQAEDPALVAALGRVEVPQVSVRKQTDEARLARMAALATRKGCLEKARAALRAHEAELGALLERVSAEEAAAKHRALQKSVAAQPLEEPDTFEADLVRAVEGEDDGWETPNARPPAAPTAQPQRRATPRATLCAEISLASDSNFFTGFTNDISEGGLFVATVDLLPLGAPVDLSFSLPNGTRIAAKGEVRWVREFDERNPDVFPGMGIKFTEISQPSLRAIHAFTSRREPMFFPEH